MSCRPRPAPGPPKDRHTTQKDHAKYAADLEKLLRIGTACIVLNPPIGAADPGNLRHFGAHRIKLRLPAFFDWRLRNLRWWVGGHGNQYLRIRMTVPFCSCFTSSISLVISKMPRPWSECRFESSVGVGIELGSNPGPGSRTTIMIPCSRSPVTVHSTFIAASPLQPWTIALARASRSAISISNSLSDPYCKSLTSRITQSTTGEMAATSAGKETSKCIVEGNSFP